MNDAQRARFDGILERAVEDLPPSVRELLDETPLIAEDRPSDKLLADLSKDFGEPVLPDELCGLHTGTAFTERSVQHSDLPSEIRIFREGILAEAGGWEQPGENSQEVEDAIYEEIRVTILHELGHQFGLDEDDLEDLGYQ